MQKTPSWTRSRIAYWARQGRRYLPLALGIIAYAGLCVALRLGPFGSAQAQIPIGTTTVPLDLRVLGGPNLCQGGRNVVAFVDQAVALGVQDIMIPPGCTYVPDNNITPADTVIEGGNWETSIIQSSSPTTLDVSVGPRGILKNISVNGNFCQNSVGGNLCPLVEVVNVSDAPYTIQTFPGTGIVINTGNSVTFGGQSLPTPAAGTAVVQTSGNMPGLSNVYTVATLPQCTIQLSGTRLIVGDAGFPVIFNGPVGLGRGGGQDPMAAQGGGQIRAPVICIDKRWVFG